MKIRNNYAYRAAAALLPVVAVVLTVLAAGCTRDDDFAPSPGDPPTSAPPLTITVTDGAYAPAADNANPANPSAAPATRAVECGYGTEFTAGDKIGLYEVTEVELGNGTSRYSIAFQKNNLCLTYDGTAWTLPPGAELTPERPADGSRTHYYAYYPWQQDKDMGGKTVIAPSSATESQTGTPWTTREFFDPLIGGWGPASDQSTYAAYTASDLMVSRGTVAKRTDGADGSELRFEMEHQMALAVIRVPSTEYTYTETVSGSETEKSYRLYTGMSTVGWWQENSHTARLLVNPQHGAKLLNGYYYTAELKECRFSVTTVGRHDGTPGTYCLYTIDGGAAAVRERPLAAGDFYMRDGSILPREAADGGDLPADVQADCLGVVFWVGEKKGETDISYHWTYENSRGDRLLMHDHPECTHGIVVALKDATDGKTAWSSTDTGSTYTWLKSYAATGQEAEKELMLGSFGFLGYNMSRRLQWYRNYGGQSTEAYDAIEAFAKATPTPAGCSGWYFPGDDEMTVMARGTLNYSEDHGMSTILNTQFDKAGGSSFKTDNYYWSSTDSSNTPGKGYCIKFSDNGRSLENKQNTYYVRAVLAF